MGSNPWTLTINPFCGTRVAVDVGKAQVDGDETEISDMFYVTFRGNKIVDEAQIESIKQAVHAVLSYKSALGGASRPKFGAAAGKSGVTTLMGEQMKGF